MAAYRHRRKLLLGPGAQAPYIYDQGAHLYDEPPHFCDVILSKLCFNLRNADKSTVRPFPAVLDILRKGLNLQAPLDIQ